MSGNQEFPGGAGREPGAVPPGPDEEERAAQRDRWRRVERSYRRTKRGSTWQRRVARGTLPARAGMHRRPPPPGPDGNDAA